MSDWFAAVRAGMGAEIKYLWRSPLLLILSAVQAVTFLLLVSLFGITGSQAPTGLVLLDKSPLAQQFVDDLASAHHSFALQQMSASDATAALKAGKIVDVITIPENFSSLIKAGQVVRIPVAIDNVDADLTDDVERALPSAIVAFAAAQHFPQIHVHLAESDLLNHDTPYIPYLVVSGLALDALVVAGLLGASAVAREFEIGTASVMRSTPIGISAPVLGRVLATMVVAFGALLITALVVVFGYGVKPQHPLELLAVLAACVAVSGALGAMLGALIRRTLPIAALVFGLALPLYLDSGALEPERFDGQVIWIIAHISPVYYGVGLLQDAVNGLRVTPEPVAVNAAILCGWLIFSALVARWLITRVPAQK